MHKQLELEGMETPALLGLRRFIGRQRELERRGPRRRKTKAQQRNEASRRDPRQASMYGPGHTFELQEL
jgi:hypothetical protein